VWHQELICPGAPCRGRLRAFPPGVLVDDGRGELRSCPACGAAVTAPAFYLAGSARVPRAREGAASDRPHDAVAPPLTDADG
jgi:hypothetical protein